MKLEVTFRNGTQSGWHRKLHSCDLSQILCLVAIEEAE